MRVILEVKTGPMLGKKLPLTSGRSVSLGRTPKAEVAFPHDSAMSSVHCVIECDEESCRIRDNNSLNGLVINGKKVSHAMLQAGDEIAIGNTRLLVRIEDSPVALPSAQIPVSAAAILPPKAPQDGSDLLAVLRGQFQPLFALLDAARDPKIIELLRNSREDYQSLYEGKQGEELADFAPYLVRLPVQSTFLETLVREGWGKSWGVFIHCDQVLKELRKHFRHFLMVKFPDGREVYFRYYDPRVLRTFLPACNPEETNQFFGPVKSYLMEDENSQTLLRFTNQGRGVAKNKLTLSKSEEIRAFAVSTPAPHFDQTSGVR